MDNNPRASCCRGGRSGGLMCTDEVAQLLSRRAEEVQSRPVVELRHKVRVARRGLWVECCKMSTGIAAGAGCSSGGGGQSVRGACIWPSWRCIVTVILVCILEAAILHRVVALQRR